jgi:hypothetical protein
VHSGESTRDFVVKQTNSLKQRLFVVTVSLEIPSRHSKSITY